MNTKPLSGPSSAAANGLAIARAVDRAADAAMAKITPPETDTDQTLDDANTGESNTGAEEVALDKPAFDLESLLPPAEFAAPEGEREPIAILKHKSCRRFKVGQFVFKDYHLRLYTEEEAIAWSKVFPGMDTQDRNAIVTVNARAVAASETPYKPGAVMRGAMSTGSIKDPKTVK